MRRSFRRTLLAAAAAAAALTIGCDSVSEPAVRPVARVDTIIVAPVSGAVWAGDSLQLRAQVRRYGILLPDSLVRWSTTDTAIVALDALTGKVYARRDGAASIVATVADRHTYLRLEVAEQVLLYQGGWTGLPEAMTLRLTGEAPQRVLPPYTLLTDPAMSAQGTLAYVVADYLDATGDIFAVGRGSNVTRQLTDDPEMDDQPNWSPDCERIAFRTYRAQRLGQIHTMRVDGSEDTRRTWHYGWGGGTKPSWIVRRSRITRRRTR